MVKEGDVVAIFHSIHRVMKAETALKAKKIPMLLIPAPRALHADCGLAIRYSLEDRLRVEGTLSETGLGPEEIWALTGEGYHLLEKAKESA
jgi:hypothetical protein